MLGIDIYRYQTVTDWNAVRRHGVSFVYVKGSDGGGPAIVRADVQVRGAQSVDLPVGLYHYAQLSPGPEAQANILTAEVRRLNATGLPPALDLESPFLPNGVARDFARRFLTQLRNNGFNSVTLYANTSMLTGIAADTIGVPGTVIWAANYGNNDGNRHSMTYRGKVDVHQYTSVGLVRGISGRVDMNESLTNALFEGEEDMPTAEEIAAAVWNFSAKTLNAGAPDQSVLPMWVWLVGSNMGAWAGADGVERAKQSIIEAIAADDSNDLNTDQAKQVIENAIRTVRPPATEVTVSPDLIVKSLSEAMNALSNESFVKIAKAVQDEADRRQAARSKMPV